MTATVNSLATQRLDFPMCVGVFGGVCLDDQLKFSLVKHSPTLF
jgi:hypothetical protein